VDAITAMFLEAADGALDLVGRDEVAERWDDPSVLPGYHVGGLAAHLARAVLTVHAYLSSEPPSAGSSPLSAAEYFAAALGDHDPVDSDFHAGVRARGEEAAAAGHAAVVEQLRSTLQLLREIELDRDVAVLAGLVMHLRDYLETRLVELAIHTDDLAASVGVPPPWYRTPVWETVTRVVVETAVERTTAKDVALGMARPDRHSPVAAFG
jgi:hypothetical protein